MSQRRIREYDAQLLFTRFLPCYDSWHMSLRRQVTCTTDIDTLEREMVAEGRKFVIKPDMLFKRRGKLGLVLLNAGFPEIREYIAKNMNREVTVNGVSGKLTHFLVSEHILHDIEYYVAITSDRDGDTILFTEKGGMNVNTDETRKVYIDTLKYVERSPVLFHREVYRELFRDSDMLDGYHLTITSQRDAIVDFIVNLYEFYVTCGLSFLEINPFVLCYMGDGEYTCQPLDMAVTLDDTEAYWQKKNWEGIEFPESFGRIPSPEEAFIKDLDSKTGASLKLTVLNPKGRIWTMVAGGGASVIYADTVCDLGFAHELANYGEYSGDPNTEETYQYCKTILDLMTRDPDSRGKALLIGGGIANFTDVAKTFTGIVKALKEYREKLINCGVRIYVRRGGPNYEYGLKIMRELGETLGVPIAVYGPETHMTRIVKIAIEELTKNG